MWIMNEDMDTPTQGGSTTPHIPRLLSTRRLAMCLGINPSTLYKAKQLQLPSGEIRTPDLRIRSMLLWRTEGLEDLLDTRYLAEDTEK